MNDIALERKQLPVYPAILSFGITIIRIIISALAASTISSSMNNTLLIAAQIISVVFLDQFDGVLFRRSSLSRVDLWCRRRRIFDACSDRICIQIVFFALVVRDTSLIPYYLVITAKELLTANTCVTSFLRTRKLLSPPLISKISTACIGLIAISCLYEHHVLSILLAMIIIFTGIVSMLQYRKQVQDIECREGVFDA